MYLARVVFKIVSVIRNKRRNERVSAGDEEGSAEAGANSKQFHGTAEKSGSSQALQEPAGISKAVREEKWSSCDGTSFTEERGN